MTYEVRDMVGDLLGVYTARETAKIQSRFAASGSQAQAYETPAAPQQVNAAPAEKKGGGGVPPWALWGALALGAAWLVLRK